MRRRLLLVPLLAVVLGLVTTVVVAWGCALLLDVMRGDLLVVPGPALDGVEWRYAVHRRAGAARTHVGAIAVVEGAQGWPPLPSTPPPAVPSWHPGWPAEAMFTVPGDAWTYPATQDARGWPWLAMTSLSMLYYDKRGDAQAVTQHGLFAGARGGPGGPGARILPLAILWPGFLANSFAYAALWAALLVAPAAIRTHVRRRRHRRGVCPRCRYPVGRSDRCAECGEPLHITA